ncbi:histone-lysine N-methyltransferase SETMAR [Trichonephila clavipes]|nr:histone-lysine N-methyltransferase SETMAR [Trichonephila clavipes]
MVSLNITVCHEGDKWCRTNARDIVSEDMATLMTERDQPTHCVPLTPINFHIVPTEELFPHGQTLNSDLYSQQLDRLKLAIDQKWPELVNRRGAAFHQVNARTHNSVVTRQKPWELGWEVLMHPPYSPAQAPNHYHLPLALQNFLSDKKLGSREDCENLLLDVFANKSQDFYDRGIMKPPL